MDGRGPIGLFACALAACGNDPAGYPDARPRPVDAGPELPYVLSVSPPDGAVDVEGDVIVTAVFSESMDPATINDTTFTVTGPAGSVPGEIIYDGWTATALFRVTEELTKFETYTVGIAEVVADLEGNSMAAPFTSTFTVAERWWHPPQVIHLADGAGYPEAACDDSGNVMVVWQQAGSSGFDLYATRRVGPTWETPMALEASSTHVSSFDLDMVSSGDAIVAWNEYSPWVRQYRTGIGWDAAVQLAAEAEAPRVAINLAGDAMAVWMDPYYDIQVARYTRAAGWEASTKISTDLSAGAMVELADSGDGLVLWYQNGGSATYHNWWREYRVATGWSAPLKLATSPSGVADLAMTPAGDALAVWPEGGPPYDVVARRYSPIDGWSAATTLYSDTDTTIAAGVRAASAADGSAIVIWGRRDPVGVVARRFDGGTSTWEPSTTVSTEEEPEAPVLAIDAAGNAFAAWMERREATADHTIVAAHYADGRFVASDIEDLETSTGYQVALAACPGGQAIVVWREEGAGLYASDYR